jgi:hypothetical protein
MDEVASDGSAELLDGGSIHIEFACHDGDEPVIKANGTLLRQTARGCLAP